MARPKQRPVERVLRPREGFRDVTSQFRDFVHVGGNTFGRKRKPLHEETR